MTLPLFAFLLTLNVSPALRNDLATVALEWWPCIPSALREVRYCREEECDGEQWGGGKWEPSTGTIIIWPNYPWPASNGLRVTLAHEYGHALGLDHVDRSERVSIMNRGWEWPYGEAPTLQDVEAAMRAGSELLP